MLQIHEVKKKKKKAMPGILISEHAIWVTIGSNCQSPFRNILIYSWQTDIQIGRKNYFLLLKSAKKLLPVWSLQLTNPSINTGQISALKGKRFQRWCLIVVATTSLLAYFAVCRIDTYVLMNKFIDLSFSNINMNRHHATETYPFGML